MMSESNVMDAEWAWRPYEPSSDNPWNRRLAAHLYRRAGLGADAKTLDAAVRRTPIELVDDLISENVETSQFRTTADALARTILASGDARRLSAAWVYRLLFTPNQLLEKVTLFWHGHFATSAEKVKDASLVWNQNQILREHALGSFRELVRRIAKDPAMLIYLDSAVNRKSHPNENFARELMELFCLGEGHYSERDVQELARCFTGWEIKNKKFRKNRYQQDRGEKIILGQTGNFDGEDAVAVVLDQPELEQFMARKWYRFFISDAPEPTAELLAPLATAFRQNDLQIAPAVKMILQSNLFYSNHSIGRKIKSPVELVLGTLRCFQATTNMDLVAKGLVQIGQGLFYPPNVKGWDGGRTWINSSTLLGRANLISDVLANEATRFNGQSLSEYLASLHVRDTAQAIDHFEMCLLPNRLSSSIKAELEQSFRQREGTKEQSFRDLLHSIVSLPHCQLG